MVDVSKLFNPQSFLTAIKQVCAAPCMGQQLRLSLKRSAAGCQSVNLELDRLHVFTEARPRSGAAEAAALAFVGGHKAFGPKDGRQPGARRGLCHGNAPPKSNCSCPSLSRLWSSKALACMPVSCSVFGLALQVTIGLKAQDHAA